MQLAVHIDVDPKVGTDGGCFGLIAALTLGTAAGETGSHWSWENNGAFWGSCEVKFDIIMLLTLPVKHLHTFIFIYYIYLLY